MREFFSYFPSGAEWLALWPMWLVLLGSVGIWRWSAWMGRSSDRWEMILREEEARQWRMLRRWAEKDYASRGKTTTTTTNLN